VPERLNRGDNMNKVEELIFQKQKIQEGGGLDKIEKQHEKGKLFA
jgi:acetyl-CoA carboxylase carboxyltransferase component